MTKQPEIGDAAHEIGRRLGVDVYGVFEHQKNLIDLAIIAAIAYALMKDYISGFVDMKKVGQAHRTHLSRLIQRIRDGRVTAEDKRPSSVEADIAAAQALVSEAELESRQASGVQSLRASLEELGLSGPEADACAADISKVVSKVLKIRK